MKNLEIKNSSYRHLIYGFREWLDILGFCSQTVYNMPHQVQEFLHFLENKGINHITQISPKEYKDYYDYLNTRPNQRRSGGLTNMYINHQIKALTKFYEFLIHKGANGICPVVLKQIKLEKGNITVLTQEEIRELYEATKKESRYKYQEALNGRDRAMLSVFYGCGLRRIEGSSLDIDDINFDRRTLHVRRGKNYKERLIPFSKSSSKYLKDWIYDYRLRFVKDKKESTLFISRTGKPMTSGALYRRLKLLVNSLDDTQIHSRDIGLHTLRHSIATHLLENGMELSKIQRFLGHNSLESTQIYTHLIHENEAEENRSLTS